MLNIGIINFELFDFCYMLIGFIIGITVSYFYISKLKKEIKQTKRQYEKKSIGMDDSNMKVKTLENKIKTLEIALKKQMENN